jgi:hypothetical protein
MCTADERRPSWPAPGWRPYDEQGASHVLCSNGTTADTFDRPLAAAMVRAVLVMRATRRAA